MFCNPFIIELYAALLCNLLDTPPPIKLEQQLVAVGLIVFLQPLSIDEFFRVIQFNCPAPINDLYP